MTALLRNAGQILVVVLLVALFVGARIYIKGGE